MRGSVFIFLWFLAISQQVGHTGGSDDEETDDDVGNDQTGKGGGDKDDDDVNDAASPDADLPPAIPQDIADAANMANARFCEKVVASILPFRDQAHRQVINIETANHNNGQRFIPPNYLPTRESNTIFNDLCFAMVNDPITVLAMYLGEFLHVKDETMVIITLTLCQNRERLHEIYDHIHKNGLDKRRKKQPHPFSNLMRVWIEQDRDPEGPFMPDDVNQAAENLKNDCSDSKKIRGALEDVLIRKSLPFALAVVQKFELDLKITIEDAIKQHIKKEVLINAYTSLALYVKDKYNYMATTMLQHSDGAYKWAVWSMMIGINTPEDWTKINTAFKKINNDESLRDHILKVNDDDRIPFEMMAVVMDPTYKPTYL